MAAQKLRKCKGYYLILLVFLYVHVRVPSQWKMESNQSILEELKVPGVMVTSKTNPSFDIWLFPNDSISTIIQRTGIYEPEETEFIKYVAASTKTGWAVDIGANLGFHSLHMAALGMNVLAFEPSPDTASLLQRSIQQNEFHQKQRFYTSKRGFVKVVQAAAAETPGIGRMVRYTGSAGMTILQRNGNESSLPFGIQDVIAEGVPLVRPETDLANILPRKPNLQLLKVDAEGHELNAFRGVNLERFPFPFLTFELFPELLWEAGQTDPLDLLNFVHSMGYACSTNQTSVRTREFLLSSREDVKKWYDATVVPSHKQSRNYHLNLYCERVFH